MEKKKVKKGSNKKDSKVQVNVVDKKEKELEVEKVKKGDILSTTDNKLLTNKDTKRSKKSRLVAVSSVNETTEDLTAIKIYTHGGNIKPDEVIVDAQPSLKKESVYGQHIITHEEVVTDEGKEMKRLNMKNGNLRTTPHSVPESNLDKAIKKMSKKEKRKLERNK